MNINQSSVDEAHEYLRRHGWATDTTIDPVDLLRDVVEAVGYWQAEADALERERADLREEEQKVLEKWADVRELEKLLTDTHGDHVKVMEVLQGRLKGYQELNGEHLKLIQKLQDENRQLKKDLEIASRPKKRGRPRKKPIQNS